MLKFDTPAPAVTDNIRRDPPDNVTDADGTDVNATAFVIDANVSIGDNGFTPESADNEPVARCDADKVNVHDAGSPATENFHHADTRTPPAALIESPINVHPDPTGGDTDADDVATVATIRFPAANSVPDVGFVNTIDVEPALLLDAADRTCVGDVPGTGDVIVLDTSRFAASRV